MEKKKNQIFMSLLSIVRAGHKGKANTSTFQTCKGGIFNVTDCDLGSILFYCHCYHENPAGTKSFKSVAAVFVSGGRIQLSAQHFTYVLLRLFSFHELTYLILQPTFFP